MLRSVGIIIKSCIFALPFQNGPSSGKVQNNFADVAQLARARDL